MINDLKLGMKMLRYAYGLKSNLAQAGVFLALGVINSVIRSMDEGFSGKAVALNCLFFSCIGMLPVQMLFSLNMSSLVQASPVRKRMLTSVPVLLNCGAMLLIYLLECLLCGIGCLWKPELTQENGRAVLIMAVMSAFMMLYMGICYKYFVLATLVVIPSLCVWVMGKMNFGGFTAGIFEIGQGSFLPAVLVGLGILAVGGVLEYLLTLLFYRAPLSKLAQPAPLRKFL